MALVLNDRVKETTTTTGTGTVTLGGAVSGFDTFAAGIGNSNTTYYCIQLGAEFEVGLGTLAGDSSTLARTTVISSSNSDNAVNFSAGAKNVFCTLPASKATVLDASGNLALAGNIDVDGTSNLDVVDIDGAVDMASTLQVDGVLTTTATQVATGGITSGSNIVSDTDSTDDLGTTSVRWANLFVDGVTVTGTVTATTLAGTLSTAAQPNITSVGTLTSITTTGNLAIGTEDNNSSIIEVNGAGAGGDEGGEIRLDMAADHDGTYNHYRIDVFQDDLRIGRAGTTDITLDGSGDVTLSGTLAARELEASNGITTNNATVSASYTFPTGHNGMSAGPITIANGVTVTVPSGQRWVIL
jgi:hypothetical protein